MSIRLADNENDLFASYEIRKAFIDHIKKFKNIPLPAACEACGISYNFFLEAYLKDPHPDKDIIGKFINPLMFKNLLKLFGMDLKYTLYLQSEVNEEEVNGIIRKRIRKQRSLRKGDGPKSGD